MIRCIQFAAFLMISCSIVHGDTIVTKENVTINGTVSKMANGEMVIVARYESGEKTLTIRKTDAESIEFNKVTSNSVAPPKAIGLGPPRDGSKSSAPATEPADTIVLKRGQQRRACNLLGFDEETVHCEGKGGDYPRKLVLRIVLGTQ
jgi:hypothetical protein